LPLVEDTVPEENFIEAFKVFGRVVYGFLCSSRALARHGAVLYRLRASRSVASTQA